MKKLTTCCGKIERKGEFCKICPHLNKIVESYQYTIGQVFNFPGPEILGYPKYYSDICIAPPIHQSNSIDNIIRDTYTEAREAQNGLY